jgi:hypothetical protein
MERENHTLALSLFAVAMTITALSQTLIYKIGSPTADILWVPLAVITKALTHNIFAMLFAAIFQFPLFTLAFGLGYRRWPAPLLLAVLVFCYLVLVSIAAIILQINYANRNA